MKFTHAFLWLVIGAIGCAEGPTAGTGPNLPPANYQPPTGEVAVSVDVTGDPTTGPAEYEILVNNASAGKVAPGDILRLVMREGPVTVTLSGFGIPVFSIFTPIPTWCYAVGSNKYAGTVVAQTTTQVAMQVNCPPLVGTGVISVTVATSGAAVSDEFLVTLSRMTPGPAVSRTQSIRANTLTDIPVPVGVYRLAVGPTSRCKLNTTLVVFGIPAKLVRDGSRVSSTLSMTCT